MSDPTFTVLLWYWQHYSLEVEDADSVDDAVRMAASMEDGAYGAPCGLEIAGPNGVEWMDEKALDGLIREQRRQRAAEPPEESRPVHGVWLSPPAALEGGEDAVAWSSHDAAQTALAAERLRLLYGADRITVR